MPADSTLTSTFPTPPSPAGAGQCPPPPPGTRLADRFLIEELAGRGGMGSVFRARDLHTDERVALKLLHAVTSPEAAYRFNREAVLLAELRHPAIVSYVAHGTTQEGQPFLVMEWLEGEDLAHRLLRQPLSLSETLALLRRAAEGLATAHQQGIVHRDLKPSNLFLRGGRPEDVVLLDFGLARHAISTDMGVTGSNIVVGTPGYMAPEQASSQADIPPAADIFSLGCVLYECLMGQPPFKATHFAAALAKILFADPLPLLSRRADLPPGIQVLVDQMLVKEPQRRLPDASRLLDALSALGSAPTSPSSEPTAELRPPPLVRAEQQLVSVLMVSLPAPATNTQKAGLARGHELRDSLRTALAPYGARVELLADGSLVATLRPERGTATDQAALAARCALTLRERLPGAAVVLVTGLGILDERLPVGEAMDRAGQLLRHSEQPPASDLVVMDEVTAGLLGPGFQLSRSHSGTFLLQGEQLVADASRPLLGRPTPCVGREQELALLELTLTSCIEESAARALLVTAPAGVGKSRLRHEFLRRVERGEQSVLVLLGRGDPMSTGASQSLLGQAVRRLCGITERESLEERRARLEQRIALHLPAAQAQETVEFLGELCALPFPDEDNPRLRAARSDPRLMSAQLNRALVAFLGAECAHHPVLLILEDLHWSDTLTIKLVEEVLRELVEQPLLVLALARPEVKALFPNLWSRHLQELSLNGLSRKASARLVREVLGPQVAESFVKQAVEQSDGNALFLEELIRMVAEGRGEDPPKTVLAVLQARLLRMEPELRQVLLVASIFGRTFWSTGVQELLATRGEDALLDKHLRRLMELEVIESLPTSRFLAADEYRFRHALVRDAAYGLVTDSHKPLGHGLAGTWLERMGEPDVLELATHYQLGQQPERAARFYTRAAEQRFERNDLSGTMRCVEAALTCGVEGETLNRLRALQSVVLLWMHQLQGSLELGSPVLDKLPAGSRLWCRLIVGLLVGSSLSGRQEQSAGWTQLLLRTTPEPDAVAAYVEALAMLGAAVVWTGARPQLEVLRARILQVGTDILAHDAMARGWMRLLETYSLHFLEAAPWRSFLVAEQARQDFREIGSERNADVVQGFLATTLAALGDPHGALTRLREALASAQRQEQTLAVAHTQQYLIPVLAGSCEPAHWREARVLALAYLENELISSERGLAHAMLAQALAAQGELSEAESHAREACALLVQHLTFLLFARSTLSNVLRAQGRATEARREAALGVQELEQMASAGVYAVRMRLALAEACYAEGDAAAGETALREAVRCVRERASDIPDPALRERFLRQVPEHARTLELAHQRWGESQA